MPPKRARSAGRGRTAARHAVYPVGRPTTRSVTRAQQRDVTAQQVQQPNTQQVQKSIQVGNQPTLAPRQAAGQCQPPIVQQPSASTSQAAVLDRDKDIVSLSKRELSDLMEKGDKKASDNASQTTATQDTSQIHAIDAAKPMTDGLLQGEESPLGIHLLTPKPPLAINSI